MKIYKYFFFLSRDGGKFTTLALPDPLPADGLVLGQLRRSLRLSIDLQRRLLIWKILLVIEKNKSPLNFLDGRGNARPWQPRTKEIFDVFPISIDSHQSEEHPGGLRRGGNFSLKPEN